MTHSHKFFSMVISLVIVFAGCGESFRKEPKGPASAANRNRKTKRPDLTAAVHSFCADCHQFPPPDTFAKDSWHEEVDQGFQFYLTSGRSDLQPPPFAETVKWFKDRAPDRLTFPTESSLPSQHFEKIEFQWSGKEPLIAVSQFVPFPSNPGTVILSDMHSGHVWKATLKNGTAKAESICAVSNPCRTTRCDMDNNGEPELLVSDLGSFLPKDHSDGGVWWLEPDKNGGFEEPQLVIADVGRVCDISIFDYDKDGDQDLLLAEFGWLKTGSIRLCRNDGLLGGRPTFHVTTIDPRHGVIDVPVVDLNKDGWPDFIALISQEFEAVDAFVNDQNGGFTRVELYHAPHPAFGSSSIHCVDIDGDSDVDVLYSNGDSMDSTVVKPCHGLWLLENEGADTQEAASGPGAGIAFAAQRLTELPGAYDVVSADFDQDGDLDIASISLVPPSESAAHPNAQFPAAIWLEQTSVRIFRRHVIQATSAEYAALLATDVNGDGRPDLVTAKCSFSGLKSRTITGYLNRISKVQLE